MSSYNDGEGVFSIGMLVDMEMEMEKGIEMKEINEIEK